MLFPLIPLVALCVAVLSWSVFLYVKRTSFASDEIKGLGLLVCVNATGVLAVLALCTSQEYIAWWMGQSAEMQSIAKLLCK